MSEWLFFFTGEIIQSALKKWSRCGGDDSWGFRRCWLQKATFEVQDSHANLARIAFSRRGLAIPHREIHRPGAKEGEWWTLNKWSRCGWPFSWGLRAKGGAARRQTKDFTREFFPMFISSPRSSDPARRCRAGRLPKKVVFSSPETPV